jgi:aspartyl-tRNA(Asn)/glutamyl-tRNA(Gln) amidotransferase subunit A
VRTLIKRDFEQVFDGVVDAVLTPTTPSPAFPVGSKANASIRWRCICRTSSP